MPILLKKEIISETKNLFIFNPEHDLALAVGKVAYTPPPKIARLRREFSLLPAIFADNGDFIIIPDAISKEELTLLPWYDTVLIKNLNLISLKEADNYLYFINQIIPWGWDHAIWNEIISAGIPESFLPSIDKIDKIRTLSHRRTTIPFLKLLAIEMNGEKIKCPVELFHLDEIKETIERGKTFYYKAPWSSSGRGIVVSDHISKKGLLEWAHGVIKKQGSVMVEEAWDRKLDFATEWWIKNREPKFLGFSIFETSSRGKYHGNIEGSQEDFLEIIRTKVPSFDLKWINAQYAALKKLISPFYEGPLGIDMLADSQGRINPCVEINLRLTMGHIPILKGKNLSLFL